MSASTNGLLSALGIVDSTNENNKSLTEMPAIDENYDVVPNSKADEVDLSELRGVTKKAAGNNNDMKIKGETDLENLAELVPDIRERSVDDGDDVVEALLAEDEQEVKRKQQRKMSVASKADSTAARRMSWQNEAGKVSGSLNALESKDDAHIFHDSANNNNYDEAANNHKDNDGSSRRDASDLDDFPDSDHALEEEPEDFDKVPKEFINNMSSNQSISTATQTHEVRMPMYLPTFKPATGCTNASDFIVRCFIARLRAGITVVKHGRSRWCKSRLRILHIHPDGRSLSWKPAEGEPNSSKRPPKLDLTTCTEVRHAWSPDPQSPMYTGTPILRQKCEAANAHKSFALIFKQRTVDVTAVTADQCKVLMEGFSALCFRLQVATLAGRNKGQAMPEEDGASTTASNTLTNSSTPRGTRS